MKILIADDHPIVRSSLAQLLKVVDENAEVVEASNFDDAVDMVSRDADIELVLLDLRMPGKPAFESLGELTESRPNLPIVIVSAVESREDALRAIELGAMGYIPKTMSADQFELLLRRVLDGQVAMPRSLLERGASNRSEDYSLSGDRASRERIDRLTRRQQEVLGFLAHGKSNMQIAQDLGLSEKTVRLHVSAILKTLKLSNRTQAALMAVRTHETGRFGTA